MAEEVRAFVSGHRDLTAAEFHEHYAPALERAMANGDHIVVCDYVGADIMAQAYLNNRGYSRVTVVHMFSRPRNAFLEFSTIGGFESDEARDAWCTANTAYDIAWSRKPGSGTERNLIRRQEINNVAFHEKD